MEDMKLDRKDADNNDIWHDYQLSAEVIAMAPAQHKNIYGDYKEELAEQLEEKYNTTNNREAQFDAQQKMIKESLTRSFDELHAGKVHHDARKLFNN